MNQYLSAQEAAEELGISVTSLYAYVSRGQLRSEVAPDSRQKRYLKEDVERLKQRKEQRRDPARVAAGALHWGTPVLDSALTLIDGERLYYRGHDATRLAAESSAEEVASLLWRGELAPLEESRGRRSTSGRRGDLDAVHAQLNRAATRDIAAFDLRPASVASTASRILRLVIETLAGRADETLAAALQRSWSPRDASAREPLNAALILCADHELNISSFTARCIAAARSTPYSVVSGALHALQGVRHGGMTNRVEALIDEIERGGDARAVIAERLQRGDDVPGFGHPLYRSGDPRARLLLDMLERDPRKRRELDIIRRTTDAAEQLLGERPTIDLGLVAVARAYRLQRGTPLQIFAAGRTIGWLAHAIEQYAAPESIRPRARYVGPKPA